MTTEQATLTAPLSAFHVPHPTVTLLQLPTIHTMEKDKKAAIRPALVTAYSPNKHAFSLIALAIALHAFAVWSAFQRGPSEGLPKNYQEIELISPPPEVQPEPPHLPPEPPQQKPIQSVVVQHAALRTGPAQEPPADTLTVVENLTAPVNTGPVVSAPPEEKPPAPAVKIEDPLIEANGATAYLNNPSPSYPQAAQRLGLQGRVLLRVQVLANGQVGKLEIKQSSGKTMLDDAALNTVKNWIFTPAKRGSNTIDSWTHVPIVFRLN